MTEQVPAPVQAPLQPVKFENASGVAVRTSVVPRSGASVQSVPQSMPAGSEATAPPPGPARCTVSTGSDAFTSIVAGRALLALAGVAGFSPRKVNVSGPE